MSEEDQESKFKFSDKRRFDASGNSRADQIDEEGRERPREQEKPKVAPSEKPAAQAAPQAEPKQLQQQAPAAGSADADEGIDFSSFVMSLATQALIQMGEMKPPPGYPEQIDLAGAKQSIDILSMMEIKTKGNLDAEEKRMMDEILHGLRMSFVKVNEKK